MEINEAIEKIGKDKLKEAVASNDPDALQALVEAAGLELTDEQIEHLAGGYDDDDFTSTHDPRYIEYQRMYHGNDD